MSDDRMNEVSEDELLGFDYIAGAIECLDRASALFEAEEQETLLSTAIGLRATLRTMQWRRSGPRG
jgi:hypothetical protein